VIEEALGRYVGDAWWRSEDIIEIAYCQLQEDILLVPTHAIYQGLYELLGRPVSPEELDDEETRVEIYEEVAKAVTLYVGEKIDEINATYGDSDRAMEKIHKLTRRYNIPTIMLEYEDDNIVNISYGGLSEEFEEEMSEAIKDLYSNYDEYV
ncbi:MAG: hypothetical protein GOV00_04585, partial [Candidatus Altiarchaeota archaeon]|nr:hypothetical protein [Candidatus Altiarchaeota archaeon]